MRVKENEYVLISTEEMIENGKTNILECTVKSANDADLSLIVPTYNESENITELVDRLESSLSFIGFELIIVDDNSLDGTDQIVHALNGKYGNIKFLKRSGKLGLSSAVLHGFKNASTGILVVMDADMQHPPEILPKMYRKLFEGYDLVVASRYAEGGKVEGWASRRMIVSKVAAFLANILLPKTRRVKDVMSGCFMLRQSALDGVNLNPIGFKILLEVLAKCNFNLIAEVPYTFRNRRNGESNFKPREILNYITHLCRIVFPFMFDHDE
jgi:dolichol-phosphate mannosyltransferase